MVLNNGKDTRLTISSFEAMARLNARFTRGDIAIDQNAEFPKIYFCTVEDGVDVPIGITASSTNLLTYFTPYMIDKVYLQNGSKPYYSALNIADAENYIKNHNLNSEDYVDKLVTLPVLSGAIDKYISGMNALGSFRIIDGDNYKDVVGSIGTQNAQYIIGTWALPDNNDNERSEFLPDDVEVTSSDTGLLKVYVGSNGSRTEILKEFILYRTYGTSNYVVRYIKCNEGEWHNITAADTSTYTAKVKSLYDRLKRTYDSLRVKYDQINQVYKHKLNIPETIASTSVDGTKTFQTYNNKLMVNLNLLKTDILSGLNDKYGTLDPSDVEDLIVRFNIITNASIQGEVSTISDSIFMDYNTLLGGVHYVRSGTNYYQIQTIDGSKFISIPVASLNPGTTALPEDVIRRTFQVFVMNVKLTKHA